MCTPIRRWHKRGFEMSKKTLFRMGELFCGPGGLACGARMAGSVMGNGIEYSICHAWATDYDQSLCMDDTLLLMMRLVMVRCL